MAEKLDMSLDDIIKKEGIKARRPGLKSVQNRKGPRAGVGGRVQGKPRNAPFGRVRILTPFSRFYFTFFSSRFLLTIFFLIRYFSEHHDKPTRNGSTTASILELLVARPSSLSPIWTLAFPTPTFGNSFQALVASRKQPSIMTSLEGLSVLLKFPSPRSRLPCLPSTSTMECHSTVI